MNSPERIITSILDNDLYKFTMQYAVIKKYPDLKVKYKFHDRNTFNYPKGFDKEVLKQIDIMADLYLTKEEKKELDNPPDLFIAEGYSNFLEQYRFNPDDVSVFFDDNALEYSDPDHSTTENRFLLLGRSIRLRVLVVCHCLRESPTLIRIISARKATSKERQVYLNRGKS